MVLADRKVKVSELAAAVSNPAESVRLILRAKLNIKNLSAPLIKNKMKEMFTY